MPGKSQSKRHPAPVMPDDAVLFDILPDALLTADPSGVIRQVNQRLTTMFGYEPGELLGQPIEVLMPERVRPRHTHNRTGYQRAPTVRSMGVGLDLWGRRKDGSEFAVDIMLSPLTPSPDRLILAVVRDITESKRMSDDLRQLAFSDPLTRLPNRSALYEKLGKLLTQTPSAPVSLALLDLDGFKEVNDTFGHSVGDELLRSVTGRWAAVLPDECRIYRLGGDEFVLLMPDCGDPRRVAMLVGTMLQALEMPFQIAEKAVHVAASVGITIAPVEGGAVDELLANADLALYRAKAAGRGRHVFFHYSMRAEFEARRNLDLELRNAHLNGEFELYFQPQVRLSDLSLVGAEALLRWRRNGRIVAPSAFIDALAASTVCTEVGTWILRSACAAAAAWRSRGLLPIRIAVNLFARQFNEPSFVAEVEMALAASRLPAHVLELEITENVALQSNASTLAALHQLRDMGVQLALDDFGTGYGSLSYLTQMPLTHIKIDKSFTGGVPHHQKPTAIVRSLISLAHNLGLKIIAEGVETAEQADFLRTEGCDDMQGFYFGKPLPMSAFERVLEKASLPGSLSCQAVGR
jgi:diguanylate cyclase (GGDEF)-like protein/PAS domain S-box-containing protein